MHNVRSEAREEAAENRRASVLRASEHQDQIAALKTSISALQDQNEWLTKEMKQCVPEYETQWQERILQLEDSYDKQKTLLGAEISQLSTDVAGKDTEIKDLTSQLSTAKDEVRQLDETNSRLDKRAGDAEQAVQGLTKDVAAYEAEKRATKERIEALGRENTMTRELLHNQDQRVSDLQVSEAALLAKCKAQEKALAKARRAEKSVLAILQRHTHNIDSIPSPVRPATSELAGTPTPRLPVGSFASEDDKDYDELLEIGEDV
jgi:chromosome segregation ATPase